MRELFEFRRAKDLSVREAATKLNIKAADLSAFEFQRAAPTANQVAAMAALYGVTSEQIQATIPPQEQIYAENKKLVDFLEAITVLKQHAKDAGLVRGNGGTGVLACPICKTGTIRYSVATSNGHMWAACNTLACVRFME